MYAPDVVNVMGVKKRTVVCVSTVKIRRNMEAQEDSRKHVVCTALMLKQVVPKGTSPTCKNLATILCCKLSHTYICAYVCT